ncbi:MAG: HAD-IA family hydrolase, partial [Proteobacteria bacterium]|nr:HAD-IA family hydrolase [Pseudomonadota bacterium]
RRWLTCPWVRRYETGGCSTDEFAAGMIDAWELDQSPGEFLEAFRAWPRGLFPGAAELVESLRPHAQLALLSNTNALHWDGQRDADRVQALFETAFLSHELGLVKPDREIFEHVVAALDRPAERVLFLDDNQPNVDGARAVGLRAARVKGVAQARAALVAEGVLA